MRTGIWILALKLCFNFFPFVLPGLFSADSMPQEASLYVPCHRAPLTANLLSGFISEMVDDSKMREKMRIFIPSLLSCHVVALAMAGFLSLWPSLANTQLSPGFS